LKLYLNFVCIDNKNLKAENAEVVSYFGINVKRKVTADLTQSSPSKVNVQFKRFTIGPVSFNAPASFGGFIDVTYLDEDMRLTRGDKGNIFVLTKMKGK
jgi:PAP_fibrillin